MINVINIIVAEVWSEKELDSSVTTIMSIISKVVWSFCEWLQIIKTSVINEHWAGRFWNWLIYSFKKSFFWSVVPFFMKCELIQGHNFDESLIHKRVNMNEYFTSMICILPVGTICWSYITQWFLDINILLTTYMYLNLAHQWKYKF